ncbi:MAG TPA: hypothetical protein VGN08_09430 [Solirubrobacteraceae bacterium]
MSPLAIRRYRAERLLRDEFEALRARVLAKVRGRLRASGVRLDAADLEACYGQAWQGLYSALLAGQEIESPAGWLVVVTFRRAIEEHRARLRSAAERSDLVADAARLEAEPGQEHDLAAALDDRMRLRQLFEGFRGRLGGREREAAVLCYLQGLSRSQAALQMGVSDARMRKLMDGCRAGQAGVAGKVGALVETIRAGGWCEEQGSLMRGLAYGILDPDGERHRLAVMHRDNCPACRAYVASLRGLAAVLPPVFPPSGIAAAALAVAGGGAHAAAAGGSLAGPAVTGAGMRAGAGVGSISAGAGAGGAGGGWMLGAGPLGAKLAVGCALALGVGAGCVALGGGAGHTRTDRHRLTAPVASGPAARGATSPSGYAATAGGRRTSGISMAGGAGPASSRRVRSIAAGATREFGPEQGTGAGRPAGRISAVGAVGARAATAGVEPPGPAPHLSASGVQSAADREFAPG